MKFLDEIRTSNRWLWIATAGFATSMMSLVISIVVTAWQNENNGFEPVRISVLRVKEQSALPGGDITVQIKGCNNNGELLTTVLGRYIPFSEGQTPAARDAIAVGFNLPSGCFEDETKLQLPLELESGVWILQGTFDFQTPKGETQRLTLSTNKFRVEGGKG